MQLAPCLRDKFDFSQDSQFTDWANLSFKAAKAFVDISAQELANAAALDTVQQANAILVQNQKAQEEVKKAAVQTEVKP